MRISSYRIAVLMSYLASILLLILIVHLLVDDDWDAVGVMKHPNESDKVEDKAKTIYYSPLQLTNNSWTLFDIRMGARMESPHQIGVNADSQLNISTTDQKNIMASSVNRTFHSNILIYNRVPKCASTSMQAILRHLARKNDFQFESSRIYWR